MSDRVKGVIKTVVIPVLSSVLTVIMIIPGDQGESYIVKALDALKALVTL